MRSSGTLLCLASGAAFGAMAVFGKLAYDEGATVGTLLAVRFALAAALFWALVARRRARELRALGAPRRRRRLALGACGYALQAGLLLRRARAHRRLAARAAALHVPGDRRRRRGRARPRAARRAAARRARARLRRARARRRRRGAGRARPARRGARARRRARLQRLHPRQRRIAGRMRPRVLVGARLHGRGGVAHGRLGAARRAAAGRR